MADDEYDLSPIPASGVIEPAFAIFSHSFSRFCLDFLTALLWQPMALQLPENVKDS
jgi:hypothetical protein